MNNNEPLEFGKRLKTLRENRGIKQGKLAEMLGVSRQAMSAYETGKYLPDTTLILKMADYLNCSTDYLFGRTEHENYETKLEFDESLAILSKKLRVLPEEYRNHWLDIFIGTTEWLKQDLNADVCFHNSAITLFLTFQSLVNCCFTSIKKKQNKSYTDEIAHRQRSKRFYFMAGLRRALENIDSISNNCVEQTFNESSKGDE